MDPRLGIAVMSTAAPLDAGQHVHNVPKGVLERRPGQEQ
jgi:hypothetical protein